VWKQGWPSGISGSIASRRIVALTEGTAAIESPAGNIIAYHRKANKSAVLRDEIIERIAHKRA
jgi:hypothetical protein